MGCMLDGRVLIVYFISEVYNVSSSRWWWWGGWVSSRMEVRKLRSPELMVFVPAELRS